MKRQLKKFGVDDETLERYKDLFAAINQAYKEFDDDVHHLENVLEVNSKELFVANKKLKEENLSKSREALVLSDKLDKVMDNVTDIIFELDGEGNFTYLNTAWEKYGEESPEESIGKNYMSFADRIEYFDSKAFQKIDQRNFTSFKTVYSRRNSQGKLLWWEMSVKLLTKASGKVDGAIGSLVDVTSLKETQEQLIKASEVKGRFLSTMSHEIRTPLNAVIAISNILLMQNPKESQMENLQALKFSSKHLLNLINDILDYNKMLSGNLTFSNVPFNFRFTIDGIIKAFTYTAKEKGLELEVNISDSVPEGLIGDHTRLSQVLSNLIGNAIKFTNTGRVTLAIACIHKGQDNCQLSFEVADTGIGIAEDKLEYIFERFTQAEEDTSLRFGGTGLGLAISKKIVNLLNSEINVESQQGIGTRFWFDLNYEIVQKQSLVELDSSVEKTFDLTGIKLLVVDDNEMNIAVIEQFFRKWNIEYDTASNGKEALDMIQASEYSLVLMDLRMPIMDGYTAVRKLRALGGEYMELPVIALSASVSIDVMQKVKDVGMNDYLCKPFDPEDLYAKISAQALRPALMRVAQKAKS